MCRGCSRNCDDGMGCVPFTVGQMIEDVPNRAEVFAAVGIDVKRYANTMLRQACDENGLEMREVLRKLTSCNGRRASYVRE